MATMNQVSTDAARFVPSPTPAGRLSSGYSVTPPSTLQVSPDYGPSENIIIEDQVDVAKCVDRYADEYNMDHKYRGRAVILNHLEYDNKKQSKRHGTDQDVKALMETLPKIGFRREDISLHGDLTKKEIMNEMMKLADEDHSENDCLMVFVLTHGSAHGRLHARDGHYNVKCLWKHFLADKCPRLAGKPKMFMLQACRGNECGKIVNVHGVVHRQVHVDSGPIDDEEEIEYKIPSHADFLMAYSTVEGQVCFRDPINGSWFIQTLCEKLSIPNITLTYDFVRILTRTNKRIAVGNSECETLMNVTQYRTKADIDNPAATAVVTDKAVGANKMAQDDAGRRWWCCLGKKKVQVHRLTRQSPAFNSTLTREVYFRPKAVITDVEAITD